VTNIYYFNKFRLDGERRCLWHADELVTLTPKALDTLLVLVRNSGEIVDKNVLLDEVWSDTFVEESTLAQNILTLRKTLASYVSDDQFIATVPRRGYRFVAPVRTDANGNGNGFSPVALATENGAVQDASRQGTSKSTYGIIAAVTAVLFLACVAVWYFTSSPTMFEKRFRQFRVTSILTDSNIRSATISPDGKYVALVEKQGDAERILLRQVDESHAIEIVPAVSGQIIGAGFGPQSQQIYYTRYRDDGAGGRVGELYRVPALGGPSQMIVRDVDSPVTFDRTGRLAFVRRRPSEGDTAVVTTEADGSNERIVATRKSDEAFQNASIAPDGRSIVSAVRSTGDLMRPVDIVVVDAATGKQSSLTDQRWLWIGQIAWLPDGSGVAVVGYGAMSPDLTDEVWLIAYPSGTARQLETGINGVFGVSVTSDGNSIVAVKSEKITSFVVGSANDLSKSSTIITRAGDRSLLPLGADWSPDGRIFYSSTDGANADIWSVRPDGSERRQITSDKNADLAPRASPDGRYIYYLSNRSGQMNVWRSSADGSDPSRIVEGADVFSLNVSPDGKFIYYTARADSVFSQHLWRANADGSEPIRLTQQTTLSPRISPDGKMIACYYPGPTAGQLLLTMLNAANGEIIRQFAPLKGNFLIEWQKDGSSVWLASRDASGSTLWRQPVNESTPLKIREIPNETIFRIAFSPNGESLFYEKGVSTNNVMLLSDLSPE
jgi:DNA-binding winged helix-turn-helix (wHTH) protein/Tol biopolymer transport system component